MSNFSRKRKIIACLTIIAAGIVLAALFFYLKLRLVSASEREDKGKVTWQAKLSEDIDGDGKVEKLLLTSYSNGKSKSSFISYQINTFRYREKKLTGFEEDLAFCPRKYFKISNGDIAICIFGEVGVHSENVQMLRWSDFSTINFVDGDGQIHTNLATDLPYFDFDYTALEKNKIFFDNRDYDKDPLLDTIRTHYYLDNDVFRYDGVERKRSEGQIK